MKMTLYVASCVALLLAFLSFCGNDGTGTACFGSETLGGVMFYFVLLLPVTFPLAVWLGFLLWKNVKKHWK